MNRENAKSNFPQKHLYASLYNNNAPNLTYFKNLKLEKKRLRNFVPQHGLQSHGEEHFICRIKHVFYGKIYLS
jgi:hypothetical protein